MEAKPDGRADLDVLRKRRVERSGVTSASFFAGVKPNFNTIEKNTFWDQLVIGARPGLSTTFEDG